MQEIFISILIGLLIRCRQIYHYMGTFQKIRRVIKNLLDWSFKALLTYYFYFLILRKEMASYEGIGGLQ